MWPSACCPATFPAISPVTGWATWRLLLPSPPITRRRLHTSESPTSDGTESSRHVVAPPSPPSWSSTSRTPANNYTSPSRAGTRSCCDHSLHVASPPPSFPGRSPLQKMPVSRYGDCTPPFISRSRSSGGAHATSLQPHGCSPSSSAARHALPRRVNSDGGGLQD